MKKKTKIKDRIKVRKTKIEREREKKLSQRLKSVPLRGYLFYSILCISLNFLNNKKQKLNRITNNIKVMKS